MYESKEERDKFYHGTKWKYKRLSVLERDHNECQICKRKGKLTIANTVHHIKHIEDAPELSLEEDNLVSVCRNCHELEHPERFRRKFKKKKRLTIERW
jgi:5-methylcytosine-specific restriction endonuclease McrA